LTDPTHPKQLAQRQAIGFWKKNPPRNCVEDDRHSEVINHHRGNSPARGSEGGTDLGRPLPDEQDCEKCGSSKTKQPYSYLDFSRCFHAFSETIRARVRRCAYPEREQIYAEQRPISSGNFATAVASLRRAPKQVRQQGARQESGPRFVAAACQQSNKTPTKEHRKRLPPIRPSKNVRPKRYG